MQHDAFTQFFHVMQLGVTDKVGCAKKQITIAIQSMAKTYSNSSTDPDWQA